MKIDFYLDYRSPYTYLAHTQVRHWHEPIEYNVFDITELMKRVGNVPTTVTSKPKNVYAIKDIGRWALRYEVPFARNPDFGKIDASLLLRATLAAKARNQAPAAVTALLDAMWGAPKPLGSLTDVKAVLHAEGVDVGEDLSEPDAFSAELAAATESAIERGVFGSPTIFVNEAMFFGNDRLDFVREAIESA